MSQSLQFWLSVTGVTLSFVAALSALLVYYTQRLQSRYNSMLHRVELDALRASIEHRMYKLSDEMVSSKDRWKDVNHLLISRLEKQSPEINTQPVSYLSEFLRSYGLTEEDLKVEPKLVFVLTPFNQEFWEPFEAIARACRELNLICMRGDEQEIRGDLLPHILRKIVKARVLIAIIDGRNPNVFYELGIAHALNKGTILVTSSVESAPVDMRAKKLVVYNDLTELQSSIQRELARSLVEIPRT